MYLFDAFYCYKYYFHESGKHCIKQIISAPTFLQNVNSYHLDKQKKIIIMYLLSMFYILLCAMWSNNFKIFFFFILSLRGKKYLLGSSQMK